MRYVCAAIEIIKRFKMQLTTDVYAIQMIVLTIDSLIILSVVYLQLEPEHIFQKRYQTECYWSDMLSVLCFEGWMHSGVFNFQPFRNFITENLKFLW